MTRNVIFKDISRPKLTIAKDRVEVKIPHSMVEEADRIVQVADRAIASVGENPVTLRGRFTYGSDNKYHISLYVNNKSSRHAFKSFTEE